MQGLIAWIRVTINSSATSEISVRGPCRRAALERLRGELDVQTFEAERAAGERYTLTEALRTTEIALTDVLRAASTAKEDDAADGTSGQ